MKLLNFITLGAFSLAFSLFACISLAQDKEGEILLTITTAEGATTYDLAALQEFDSVTFSTTTNWTEGLQEFTGVSLAALIKKHDINEGILKASAINDYFVEIPLADGVEDGPIVAYHINGETMTVRDKGPLWVVYPFDAKPEYRSEEIYARSIWQLDRIEVIN